MIGVGGGIVSGDRVNGVVMLMIMMMMMPLVLVGKIQHCMLCPCI